jgi:FtsP/CotA-like multicopper oxidase with cupredoxin domain
MDVEKTITRRGFLKKAALGSVLAAAALTGAGRLFAQERLSKDTRGSESDEPDLEILLRAVRGEVPILPGAPTPVWRYEGEVVRGPAETLQMVPESYLGPTIRARHGQRLRILFENRMTEKSIVHWHGLHLPDTMDGQPRQVIGPGRTYVYDFTIEDRAGTYWYHPHPHGLTGPQVYFGLAGLLIVSDEEESGAGLPSGAHDLSLVVQDRVFDDSNRLIYLPGGMMNRMTGMLGDRILVNGVPDYTPQVEPGPYRLRLLNGSNSRIYRLAWRDGTPLTVIGTDGGLLEGPVEKPYLMFGPGERVELWKDFSEYRSGKNVDLVSQPFDYGSGVGRGMGMMHRNMMGSGSALPQGSRYPIMTFRVSRGDRKPGTLPGSLSRVGKPDPAEAINRGNPRRFAFSMQGMNPTINGRTFEMTGYAEDEIVALNTSEIWELINTGGGGMMGMMQLPHPVHIHGLQFRILERGVERSYTDEWFDIAEGFVDDGYKDTALLMPGMGVRLLLKFEDHAGMYPYHCHNLEHEDLGMMRNYLIRA